MCMFACMYVCVSGMCLASMEAKRLRSSGTGVTDGCEPTCGARNQTLGADGHRVQKRVSDSLELDLQVTVSPLIRVLGPKLRYSARASHTVNHRAISPVLIYHN